MNSLVSRFNHKHIVGIRAIVTGPSQWVLHRHRKPEPSLEAGTTKLRLPYCGPIVRRQGSSESTGCRGEWTQQEKRETTQEADRTDSIKAVVGTSLNRAAEDGTLWLSVIHRVARSRSRFKGMGVQEEPWLRTFL